MNKAYKGYESARILLETSRILSSTLDIEKVSDLVLSESRKALGADHASLFLIDEASGHLLLTKAKGFSSDEIDNIKLLGSWEVVNDQLVKKRRPMIVNDVETNAIFRKKSLPFSHERLPIKSFLAVPLNKEERTVGVLIVSNRKRPGHLFTTKDEALMLALSTHIAIALLNARMYRKLKDFLVSTVTSLVRAIEAKDKYTSGHSERVMTYTLAIGTELGLGEDDLERLRLSSLLHDVGKIGISESVLEKPARLLGYERSQIKRHPLIGAKIIETIDDSHRIVKGILEHHERYDGKGYPNRLKGSRISLDGRIIAVADTFDALTTNRPYQRGLSSKEAFFIIRKASGTQFDPKIVQVFVRSFSRHPEIWMKQLR